MDYSEAMYKEEILNHIMGLNESDDLQSRDPQMQSRMGKNPRNDKS